LCRFLQTSKHQERFWFARARHAPFAFRKGASVYNFRVADHVAQIAFFVGYGFDFVHNVLLPGTPSELAPGGLVAYGDLELTLLVSVAVVAVPSAASRIVPHAFASFFLREEVVNLDSVERIYVIIAAHLATTFRRVVHTYVARSVPTSTRSQLREITSVQRLPVTICGTSEARQSRASIRFAKPM